MPEIVLRALTRIQQRWRVRSALHALVVAGASYAAAFVIGRSITTALIVAGVAVVVAFVAGSSLTLLDAAALVESQVPADNVIVTAAELEMHPRPVRAEFLDAIRSQASDRISAVSAGAIVPLGQPAIVAAVVLGACVAISLAPPQPHSAGDPVEEVTRPGRSSITVRVSPPSYTHRATEVFDNPPRITVLAGSQVRIQRKEDGRVLRDFFATDSVGLEVSAGSNGARFLSVQVIPDRPADVRITAPGKDTAFATPAGQLSITIDSRDDLGLASLRVKLTKASGGGENVTFTESDVPVQIERRSDQQWLGRARIALASLGLSEGDMVVYRAIARDTNPNGTPVPSESFVIEIGKNASIADAGFALPAEDRKYAISQQMVIYKTEQLLAAKVSGQARLDESRAIAVEQRMVRTEVVFLGGGEVEDELEEAANSSELTEGRLQNTGRIEMVRAINAMSRAEAQLNEGAVTEALVFERQALASLERAIDRRRFFLRTLPDRSRIDATRRLSGDRSGAESWTRDPAVGPTTPALEAHRVLIRDLSSIDDKSAAALAVRLTALDPSSQELQQSAIALGSASTNSARAEAANSATRAVAAHALQFLPRTTSVPLPSSPLLGDLARELVVGRQVRATGGK